MRARRHTFAPFSARLTRATGSPGLPFGRALVIHGMPESGRTSLAYEWAQMLDASEYTVAWIATRDQPRVHPVTHLPVGRHPFQVFMVESIEDLPGAGAQLCAAGYDLVVFDDFSAMMNQGDRRMVGHYARRFMAQFRGAAVFIVDAEGPRFSPGTAELRAVTQFEVQITNQNLFAMGGGGPRGGGSMEARGDLFNCRMTFCPDAPASPNGGGK